MINGIGIDTLFKPRLYRLLSRRHNSINRLCGRILTLNEQNDLNLVSQGEQRRQPYDNDYNQRNHAEQCVDSVNTVPNPYQILNQRKYQMTNNSSSSSGVQAQTQQHQYSIYMA